VLLDAVPDVLSDFCVLPLVSVVVVDTVMSCTVTGSIGATGAVVTC
jgi:hypothetical protein